MVKMNVSDDEDNRDYEDSRELVMIKIFHLFFPLSHLFIHTTPYLRVLNTVRRLSMEHHIVTIVANLFVHRTHTHIGLNEETGFRRIFGEINKREINLGFLKRRICVPCQLWFVEYNKFFSPWRTPSVSFLFVLDPKNPHDKTWSCFQLPCFQPFLPCFQLPCFQPFLPCFQLPCVFPTQPRQKNKFKKVSL